MATRAEKLRKRQRRKEKKRRRSPFPGSEFVRPPATVVFNPPGQVKMSDVLHTLVEPEWHDCEDEKAMRKLLTLGMTAWNAANLMGAQRVEFLENLAKTFPIELRQDFMDVVQPFIRRKELLFPHILRPIFSFELTWTTDGDPYIQVVSGLMPK